jgi:hypothetical protein
MIEAQAHTNVVAVLVMLVTLGPILLAYYLT